ncbi:MAG: hypothetical protein J6X18_09035 [Bacteroidales bacterium]|nr:hypothetical protein [Bacteroidales bacterium]
MADYSSTLNLYKQLQQNGAEHVDANLSAPTVMGSTVEALDEAVYGAYEGDDNRNEGQERLMETMKQVESGNLTDENRRRIEENVKNLKLPAGLIEDMLNNPLINTKVGDDDVDEFAQRVLQSSAGIQKASKIIERTEQTEKKKLEEKKSHQPTFNVGAAQVDYGKISEIVESIVNAKFAEYGKRMQLNENRASNPFNGIKVLQLKENGTFLMLDTDDNIYECTLKYKGKNKRKH